MSELPGNVVGVLVWTEEQLSPHRELISATLASGLKNANGGVRTNARKSFAAFWRLWPEEGDALLETQSVTLLRALKKDFPDLKSNVLAKVGSGKPKSSRSGARKFMMEQR